MFLIYLHYINPLFRALDLPLDRLPPRVPDPPAHAQLLGALLGVLTKKHAWNQGNVKMYIEQYSAKNGPINWFASIGGTKVKKNPLNR
jgi:hypothetical protein